MKWNGDKLSHAYIVSGSIADDLAAAAVCSGSGLRPCGECADCSKSSRGIHPDIAYVSKPDNKREILIEQIRQLKRDVIIVPNEAEKKAYVINNAELMNPNAQNAFLRILEEPPSHAVFILKTNSPAELLPTVRSRCIELKGGSGEISGSASTLEVVNNFFSALRDGGLSLASFMFEAEKSDKDLFEQFLSAARERAVVEMRKALVGGDTEMADLMTRVERVFAKAWDYHDLNVSAGHILGLICATLTPNP